MLRWPLRNRQSRAGARLNAISPPQSLRHHKNCLKESFDELSNRLYALYEHLKEAGLYEYDERLKDVPIHMDGIHCAITSLMATLWSLSKQENVSSW